MDNGHGRHQPTTHGRTPGRSPTQTEPGAPGVEREELARLVARSRAAQGLPPRVTDPTTLSRMAALLALAPSSDGIDPPRTGQTHTASGSRARRPDSLASNDAARPETSGLSDAVGCHQETQEQATSLS